MIYREFTGYQKPGPIGTGNITPCFSCCREIVGWSSADVVDAGLYNIAGVIAATAIVIKVILAKKQNLPILLLAGFAILLYYHWWVYCNLTPDLSFAQLCIPIFLQGLGSGLLFVPISILCMASAPPSTGMTGIVNLTYTRFAATLNAIAGFYTLQLGYNQHYKLGFLDKLLPGEDTFTQRQELYNGFLASRGIKPRRGNSYFQWTDSKNGRHTKPAIDDPGYFSDRCHHNCRGASTANRFCSHQ